MPQLDPKVGIPAIQLVHPEIGREKLLDLYLEVYKLHRLPGSPPGELGHFEGGIICSPWPLTGGGRQS